MSLCEMEMDARMKKYRQLSPERAKVWKEKSSKFQQVRRVPVVYYLSKNNQLEHPHFMEVPLSSHKGLYLRDVIARLNVLRGRGMVTMYSWSCKRSYKNGFVWHDLCEDDLVLPARGNEYVLKGSEIFEESSSDHFSSAGKEKIQNLKPLRQTSSSRSQDDSSSSSSMNGQRREPELSPSVLQSGSSAASPGSKSGKNSPKDGSIILTEYKIRKSEGLADASTQTEGSASRSESRETCSRGVSTDDITGTLDSISSESSHGDVLGGKENSDGFMQSDSTPPSSCNASTSGGNTETLESLIRADARKLNSIRVLEEDPAQSSNAKLKATNMLMQLISCGSISVKDNTFGIVSGYRTGLSNSKFPTPLYSSRLLGELDFLSQNQKLIGLTLEDKEYFSGSLVETKMHKEVDGRAALKRSSSYSADRTCKQLASAEDQDEPSAGHSKCIPCAIKVSLGKQPRSESMRSPLYDKPRKSSSTFDSSTGSSKRITVPLSVNNSSNRVDSFREDEKVNKIEES